MKKQESKFSSVRFVKLKIRELKRVKGKGDADHENEDIRGHKGNP